MICTLVSACFFWLPYSYMAVSVLGTRHSGQTDKW